MLDDEDDGDNADSADDNGDVDDNADNADDSGDNDDGGGVGRRELTIFSSGDNELAKGAEVEVAVEVVFEAIALLTDGTFDGIAD